MRSGFATEASQVYCSLSEAQHVRRPCELCASRTTLCFHICTEFWFAVRCGAFSQGSKRKVLDFMTKVETLQLPDIISHK